MCKIGNSQGPNKQQRELYSTHSPEGPHLKSGLKNEGDLGGRNELKAEDRHAHKSKRTGDFPGGPVAETLCYHYRGHGSNP